MPKQNKLPCEFLALEMLRVNLDDMSVQKADFKIKSDVQEMH